MWRITGFNPKRSESQFRKTVKPLIWLFAGIILFVIIINTSAEPAPADSTPIAMKSEKSDIRKNETNRENKAQDEAESKKEETKPKEETDPK